MEELVGTCSQCGKQVYCRDGFLDGIVMSDKTVLCFDCEEENRKEAGEQD